MQPQGLQLLALNQGPATLIAQEAQWFDVFWGCRSGFHYCKCSKVIDQLLFGIEENTFGNDTSNLLHFRKKFLGFGQFIEKNRQLMSRREVFIFAES